MIPGVAPALEDHPVARNVEMSWIAARNGWMKEYRGVKYAVSCRQLRQEGYPVEEDTKHGSYRAANLWWARKRSDLDRAYQPAPRPLSEVEKLVFASQCKDPSTWEQAARDMDAAGATPEEIARTFAGVVSRLSAGAEPETPCVEKHLPQARVHQVKQGLAALHGTAPASDRSIGTLLARYYVQQKARVSAGQLSAGAASFNRFRLDVFQSFLGEQATVDDLTAERLEAFYLYLLSRLRQTNSQAGWSRDYAKGIFAQAKTFIRYAWAHCPDYELPRNLSNTFAFGSLAQKVSTWTPIEFMTVAGGVTEKFRLFLLLMANCGMTQQDISDLLDEEVDWVGGYITRKRSKTADRDNVPTVRYKLWPATFALLQKFRSGTERALVTKSGQAYVRTWLRDDGRKAKADGIASRWDHFQEKLSFRRTLKELRKLGASLLARHEIYGRFSTYFLGHSPKSVADRHYVTPPQELFDQAVTWLGGQLGQVAG
jgi:integrase